MVISMATITTTVEAVVRIRPYRGQSQVRKRTSEIGMEAREVRGTVRLSISNLRDIDEEGTNSLTMAEMSMRMTILTLRRTKVRVRRVKTLQT